MPIEGSDISNSATKVTEPKVETPVDLPKDEKAVQEAAYIISSLTGW